MGASAIAYSEGRRRSSVAFWISVAVATILKLWLVSPVAINPESAGHDYTNFLSHAHALLQGQWFGPYDDLTLIKGPMFPLYLAFIAELGIPVTVAHVLAYALASFAACIAIRPLVRSGAALGAAYALLLFNPMSFCDIAWFLNRSQVMDTMALFAIAMGVGLVVRTRADRRTVLVWLLGLGLGTAGVSLSREDTPWIYAPLLAALASYATIAWKFGLPELRQRLAFVAVPLLVIAACDATIAAINNRIYGWPTTVELTSPEVTSAYQSIARIVVPGVGNRVYPAPEAAREKAYAVSPAAARLKPYFDPNHSWRAASCSVLGDCDDVSMGWFIWALRDAVAGAGYYRDGATARAFYALMSRQIDAACDSGRLTCRPKSFGLAPNVYPSDAPSILRYAFEAFGHAVSLDQYTTGGPIYLGPYNQANADEYRIVVGSATDKVHYVRGWIVRPQSSTVFMTEVDPDPSDPSSAPVPITFENSDDVRAAYAGNPKYRGDDLENSRFTVPTSCHNQCYALVRMHGQTTKIPFTGLVQETTLPNIVFHLDGQFDEPPPYFGDAVKYLMQAQVVTFYQTIVRWLAAVAAIFFLARFVRFLRGRRSYAAAVELCGGAVALVAVAMHCLALGLVSAVSFYALVPEYLISTFPMLMVWILLEWTTEGEIAYRWVSRRLAPRSQHRAAVES